MLTTVKGLMNPDGKIDFEDFVLPQVPVKVMVTILDDQVSEDNRLSEIGDYLQELESYENRLAKGEIQWK